MALKSEAQAKANGDSSSPESPPSKRAKTDGEAIWEWQDGDSWREFDAKDMAMLETQYQSAGPKSKFTATDFNLKQGYITLYEVNYEKMTRTDSDSKEVRNIRRKDEFGSKLPQWEWWTDELEWAPYATEDEAVLEKAFSAGTTPFMTTELSFNKGSDGLYIFDFDVMTQVNSSGGTSRKIQRTAAGGSKVLGHTKGEDDRYADVLAAHDGDAAASEGSATRAKFDLDLPVNFKLDQLERGAQSLRKQQRDYGPIVTKDAHGNSCFDQMLKNEEEFCGEWVVFYHSYSCAAILYEVQAAVASVLFRFRAELAALPRIFGHGFRHIPNSRRYVEELRKSNDQDHDQAFKAVGICATCSLLAHDSEAPAKSAFLMGYSVGSLNGVLEKLLQGCCVPEPEVAGLAKSIVALAAKHGLDTSGVPGGGQCKSGRAGHLLQIFLRRELCNHYAYPAFPCGVPAKKRDRPLGIYLSECEPVEGQVRITLNPDVFLQAKYARMFTYSADPTYHNNRPAFVKELVELLEPIFGDEDVRTTAATGIFGGKPPEWWTP